MQVGLVPYPRPPGPPLLAFSQSPSPNSWLVFGLSCYVAWILRWWGGGVTLRAPPATPVCFSGAARVCRVPHTPIYTPHTRLLTRVHSHTHHAHIDVGGHPHAETHGRSSCLHTGTPPASPSAPASAQP